MRILRYLLLLTLLIWAGLASAQSSPNYTVYWTGDTTDARTTPRGGVCLMGGATEHDSASAWFVRRAGGGDVVVLRTSGSDGYNAYFYNGLPGARPHSVLTIVCANRQASADPWVVRQVRQAEAVWLAGGDQATYVNYWQQTPLHAALQYLLDSTQAVFGGTSAGCAVLGNAYYSALNGSVTSAQALANPYDPLITLGANDFLRHRAMGRILTDTHFEARNRQGRLTAFLARLNTGTPATAAPFVKGIGVEEYTAVCVDTSGVARVFGDGSTGANPDVAWFVAPACAPGQGPEVLAPGQPLTWNRTGTAFTVCRVLGTPTGRNTFDLRTFGSTQGGTWEYWSVAAGTWSGGAPAGPFTDCRLVTGLSTSNTAAPAAVVLGREVVWHGPQPADVLLVSVVGQVVWRQRLRPDERVTLPKLAPGCYFLRTDNQRAQRLLLE